MSTDTEEYNGYDDGDWDHNEWPDPPDWLSETEYEDADAVATKAVADGAKLVPTPNLPDEFWKARPLFGAIRDAAHAAGYSADAVLGAVLARASAMLDPDMTVNFINRPGSLNMFVALYGGSGKGKTQASEIAQDLILPPIYLADPDSFRDGIGVGSGEGMIEIYMGNVRRSEMSDETNRARQVTVRAQVRRNAYFCVDEGSALLKIMYRPNSILGDTIRSAWMGSTLGQANANAETTREVRRRCYSMGMVVGFQDRPAQDMLKEVDVGTPQRFLWLPVYDPSIPYDPPVSPGQIRLPFTDELSGMPKRGQITCPPELRHQLRIAGIDSRRVADDTCDDLDSHITLTRIKVCGLLTALDGRMHSDWTDWNLAGLIVDMSCAIRDRILAFARQRAAKETADKIALKVDTEVAVELAKMAIPDDVRDQAIRITNRVIEKGGMTKRQITNNMFNRDTRSIVKPAIALAIELHWIREDGGALLPGESMPIEPISAPKTSIRPIRSSDDPWNP